MSLKEKNKPSKNAWGHWLHWLKSEAISIVMEFKNKAFGGSRVGEGGRLVNCLSSPSCILLTLTYFVTIDLCTLLVKLKTVKGTKEN